MKFSIFNFQFSKVKSLGRQVVILGLLAIPIIAFADLPAGNAITPDDIYEIVYVIVNFMIVTSMVLAVIFIILSGIMIMLAQADPGKFKDGLLRLKHAIWGAAVVLASGVIINTVAALVDRSFFCGFSVFGICVLR